MSQSAKSQLLDVLNGQDPYGTTVEDREAVQLAAAAEVVAMRGDQVRTLRRRMQEEGIGRIRSLADIVPLLFSHTTYKSYPESFVRDGRWRHLNIWMSALSTVPVEVDVDDCADVDEWLARQHAADHRVIASSGTSGKCSFLDASPVDDEIFARALPRASAWTLGVPVGQNYQSVFIGPRIGTGRFVRAYRAAEEAFAVSGKGTWLSQDPVLVAEINRLGQLRQRIADGVAAPSEVRAAQAEAQRKQAEAEEQYRVLADVVGGLKNGGPAYIQGGWGRIYRLAATCRQLGIPPGDFPAGSVVVGGGGLKGTPVPPDYEAQIADFFAPARLANSYGMAECNAPWAQCPAGRFHCPPTTVPLILDKSGTELLNEQQGTVVGRYACLDLTVDGRWGGIISGDRVTAHFGACPCGLGNAPQISSVDRYIDLPEGDDKLSCAGTVESYLGGFLALATQSGPDSDGA
jgi:hypothetical protein